MTADTAICLNYKEAKNSAHPQKHSGVNLWSWDIIYLSICDHQMVYFHELLLSQVPPTPQDAISRSLDKDAAGTQQSI